jgi:transglutaminase-like putative cysteine protease
VKTPVAQDSRRVVYQARVKTGQIAGLFAEGLSQRVKRVDERTAEITVLAVRPEEPTALDVRETPPSEPDRAPNNLVQSDDRLIVELANSVMPRETDAWKIACALEALVHQTVQEKSLSQAFASAAEVARTREGDCTEHAVLLAAMCRARGIAARGAFGLVYYAPKKGFAYHMWTEAWIGERWVPLDATLALGGIGADHIKLGDSHLAGGSPLADLLGVKQDLGRLELEVVEPR